MIGLTRLARTLEKSFIEKFWREMCLKQHKMGSVEAIQVKSAIEEFVKEVE